MYNLQLTVFAITVVVGRNSRGEAASDQHIGRARFHVTQTVNVNSCIVICTVCEEEHTFTSSSAWTETTFIVYLYTLGRCMSYVQSL